MSKLNSDLGLIKSHLVPVKLRVNGTELEVETTFNFAFVDSSGYTLIFKGSVTPRIELLKACFKTERALLELTKLLVAHGHIVEYLQSYEFIAL